MSRASYLTDAYRTRLETTITSRGDSGLVFDDTIFHPSGGGQPGDSGRLRHAGGTLRVTTSELVDGQVVHRLEGEAIGPPELGAPVSMEIDWDRRYRFMRYHTALHLLSGVVHQRIGSGITGNQIGEDRARMDFSIPDFSKERAEELIEATNEVAARRLPVEVRFISLEEFAQRPELVRVAEGKIGADGEARLIDIVGFDVQADGGTHVRSTAEVGRLVLDKVENKGARNKRLYLRLQG